MLPRQSSSTWADNWSDEIDDSDESRLLEKDVSTYKSTQKSSIRDHEEGLNKLGEAIKRQKYIASGLATEVDLHNEILDDIDTGLTTTNENLQKNTRNIRLVLKRSSTSLLWSLIVILALVILALAIF